MNIKNRLDKLESRLEILNLLNQPSPIAVSYSNQELLSIGNEQLSREQFRKRYPTGRIIEVVYVPIEVCI